MGLTITFVSDQPTAALWASYQGDLPGNTSQEHICLAKHLAMAFPYKAHLVDVVQFEMLQQQQQRGRNALHNDLFVSVHIDPQFHALKNCDAGLEGKREG